MSSATPQKSQQDLRSVAVYQKAILLCVLGYLLAAAFQFLLPAEFRLFLLIAVAGIGVVAAVFVFLLSLKIFNTGTGIALAILMLILLSLMIFSAGTGTAQAILTMISFVGLIVLVVWINQKATTILKKHGHKVGLLGANLSEFKQ